jgi:membrane-bound serine protease (ClpP class)
VASIEKSRREGVAYCAIPVHGTIGAAPDGSECVTSDAFRRGLQRALDLDVAVIVLEIRSDGGLISEMEQIVQAIQGARGPKFVAHVEKALSAAAIIALACQDIVMNPGARLGAAVPWTMSREGTPAAIDEKFQSAIRALMRSAAEHGGHNVLLPRGMAEMDLELCLVVQGGSPVVVESHRSRPCQGTVLKPAGRILSLTADEALRCGLARGIAVERARIPAIIGIEAWHEASDQPWHTVLNQSQGARRKVQEQADEAAQNAATARYAELMLPRVQQIQARLSELRGVVEAAFATESDLLKQRSTEIRQADASYQRSGDATLHQYKLAEIKNRIDPQFTAVRQRGREAIEESNLLVRELQEIEKQLDPAGQRGDPKKRK